MLIIYPEGTTEYTTDNESLVFTADHQPHKHYPIEADYETSTKYIDNEYNVISEILTQEKFIPDKVYFDHYIKWETFPYNTHCVPLFFLYSCIHFSSIPIDLNSMNDNNRCFIMMNKKRNNRLLVSAWMNEHKNNIQFSYTQSWENTENTKLLLQELTRITDFTNLDTCLDKNWLPYKETTPNIYTTNNNNLVIWENVVGEYFKSSTIAIITETVFWEKASAITEKYLMALYGCCFPIFCGGYKMADAVEELGFDVFDDIIDHSYQYEIHPTDRVLKALENNRNILENDKIKKTDYMDRHMKNLKNIREGLDNLLINYNIPDDIYKYAGIHYKIVSERIRNIK